MFNRESFDAQNIAQKMNFSVKVSFSKYEEIRIKLRIFSHLLEKCSTKSSFLCSANVQIVSKNYKKM